MGRGGCLIPMARSSPSSLWLGAAFLGADSGVVKLQRKTSAQSGPVKGAFIRPLKSTLKIPSMAAP